MLGNDWAESMRSLTDAYQSIYEKKKDSDKCGDDTYWDKEEKKCKSKKKSKTVIVGRGYGGHHHDHDDGEDGGDGGDGGTGGGDGGGDGGGGGE